MDDLRNRLKAVVETAPTLTLEGFESFYVMMKSRGGGKRILTREQYQETLTSKRRELFYAPLDRLSRAVEWLGSQPRRKTINRRVGSSYRLKHVFQHQTGIFIENGLFIAAALIAGLTFESFDDSRNAYFNLASKMNTRIPAAGWAGAEEPLTEQHDG